MRFSRAILMLSAFAALYAAPGDLKWKFQAGGGVFSSPAIGADGTVYFGSQDSSLYGLTQGGELKWSYKTGNGIGSSPAIGADGTVYIGSRDHNLYALSPEGELEWKYEMPSGSPALLHRR